MMIKEAIIVEGKDDIAAVKNAVDAEVIATGGVMISSSVLETIKNVNERCGIIILTDPDYAGEKIRKKISALCPGAKHAFINQEIATRDGDIGVENAGPEEIRKALEDSKAEFIYKEENFTKADLMEFGLIGGKDSKERREIFTDILGIGYSNGKQLVNRLNSFKISKEEFEEAVEEMEGRLNG